VKTIAFTAVQRGTSGDAGFPAVTIPVDPHDGTGARSDREGMPISPHPSGTERRVVVVVPLVEGSEARARALAVAGPPFDPSELALELHELLLTRREAIFVFESSSEAGLESVFAALDVWAAAETWRELVAGPPEVATVAYSWRRAPHADAIGLGL
jgi:hypothetical protein